MRVLTGTINMYRSAQTADVSASATGFHPAEPGAAGTFSHSGPSRAILKHCLGVPPEKWRTLSSSHGVSLLEFCGGSICVRCVNARGHSTAWRHRLADSA